MSQSDPNRKIHVYQQVYIYIYIKISIVGDKHKNKVWANTKKTISTPVTKVLESNEGT